MRFAIAITVVAGLCVAGCALREPIQSDTPRPWEAPGIVIGTSQESDVLALYGTPVRRMESGAAGEAGGASSRSAVLVFQNGDRNVVTFLPTLPDRRIRTTTFRFADGVLTGYSFASPFPSDFRPIDLDRAKPLLARPDTRLADLVAVLGPPQSRQTFKAPAVPPSLPDRRGGTVMVTVIRSPAAETDTWTSKVFDAGGRATGAETLSVSFGRDGRLLRFSRSDAADLIGANRTVSVIGRTAYE